VNLQDDDFTLFGLTQQFAQDRAAVDARWKELQREAHPDKFAAQGAAAQRVAMQWSVRINEAYQRLKDPLKRAAYLCELAGHPVNAHSNTAMPSSFLMQQMEWREALEEATTSENIEQIAAQAAQGKREQLQKCEHFLDVAHDYPAAVAAVRTLMFIDKLQQELDQRLDELE
jgi:molecular chaperone HscB